ncbi:vacuolar import and degradation protein-domain-containing protein [Epithele typhae]|uniref:vacuolar import and degradation protein-domain-containing protein n=1 Tax=Epithele typhae TaxID=378194 RepID=UPI002007F0CD|nr:vacuolar import and degradation protein-domain-containing protein [Epithele typhae]KAH9946137.1 vacuolar import and degradation protein-domain-containing protein [Epithele typhae]
MPTERPVHDPVQPEPAQAQVKLCYTCKSPLSADAPGVLLSHESDSLESSSLDTVPVCASCRTRSRDGSFADVEWALMRRVASLQPAGNEALVHEQAQPSPSPPPMGLPTLPALEPSLSQDVPMDASFPTARLPALLSAPFDAVTTSPLPSHRSLQPPRPSAVSSPSSTSRPLLAIETASSSSPYQAPAASRSESSYSIQINHPSKSWDADPLVDITRLRVRSQGHHCLYPGATFQGTQKSGRNSYDVNVTIVDVDFASSHLCGYLRIRGLTDDWPELTTYFDAEIIGGRYGFLTRNWGATEQEDMVHWARFPAFRHVRNELKKPHYTIPDALSRGAVFMRWKEKFLVPDHRVQDINGASFAGFYYVCVDFNPQQSSSAPITLPVEESGGDSPMMTTPTTTFVTKPDTPSRSRRISVNRGARKAGRSASRGCPSNVATMSGFYFHQNSEPYQQLSLVHVPEHTSSSFEFR